jgi:hypothetical protein
MSRVLFLDIDGVLLCEAEYRRGNVKAQFPGERAELIRQVCAKSGAAIVVSSTWRHSVETRDTLLHHGFPVHPDWRTPLNQRSVSGALLLGKLRGHEIKHWLDAHPEVESYAIVDDDSDMLPEQMPWFVKTSFSEGLTSDHAEVLIELLNTPRPPLPTQGGDHGE